MTHEGPRPLTTADDTSVLSNTQCTRNYARSRPFGLGNPDLSKEPPCHLRGGFHDDSQCAHEERDPVLTALQDATAWRSRHHVFLSRAGERVSCRHVGLRSLSFLEHPSSCLLRDPFFWSVIHAEARPLGQNPRSYPPPWSWHNGWGRCGGSERPDFGGRCNFHSAARKRT